MYCRLLTFRFQNTFSRDELISLFENDEFSSRLIHSADTHLTILQKHSELSKFHNFDYQGLHGALEQDSHTNILLWIGRIFPETIDIDDMLMQHQMIFQDHNQEYSLKTFEQVLIPQLKDVSELPFYIDLSDELIDTAIAFISNNLNSSQAAQSLYLHRNTLNYRLDKIVSYSGIDIRTFEGALVFYLYYQN
ncbi:PucR family transcriptional regulator [Culicoidibacter larvae]|uniref:PucR C-terminal helix-turn-helix domain-containing protein n=1 Tax=Culicoidibacter larvae TaxID=2579976 RepID=A0A5R8QIY2_9FIRM|nr:helix-turn-helix domain-containing protein [Culicoidibacter larvae]TLG77413.1 hypothetical protein FEZ08_01985 [Culicoidibacter larvae]